MQRNTYRIFLDTSVIIAAYGSKKGASGTIIKNSGNKYICIISEDILYEFFSKAKKLSTSILNIENWVKEKNIYVVKSPKEKYKESYKFVVGDAKDKHVLASAHNIRAHILLSLDKKHILTEQVKKALYPTLVLTPKEFLTKKPL
ncbi:putative toxin-antitoxin system toxin component, PIN family [candidate division WWE3 bacterium CG10_big_fil_rev_8_21_14_0_10_32_10]|uniref:Putative toxin-antitoxin system toxin component, PIN family n=1 Tax=candidate division WWE3 bacterium CG10_big_fil_rev_8_21_14_0_10_32_10 TaxID=1975090 RepID=A0A2H0RDA9_UNCKA|nr:MAG: putative toxin-antitoxin system toxin component, PIN family [candidate division WWE3 bacterium CG10_big_fil_rev_8_21_14_0_10_32_10]